MLEESLVATEQKAVLAKSPQ